MSRGLSSALAVGLAAAGLIVPTLSCSPRQPNILLITIDTLRRDHLGLYGYGRDTSPQIDRLAREGTVFDCAVTPIPYTSGSHATILTSRHPLVHHTVFNATALDQRVTTIAEVLQRHDYYTVGTVAVSHLSAKYRFSQGFDSFSDSWDISAQHHDAAHRIARSVNQSLERQIDDYLANHADQPLFIWVHYYDPHQPYLQWQHVRFPRDIPPRFFDRFEDRVTLFDPDRQLEALPSTNMIPMINAYDSEIRYVDQAVENLYRYLGATGIAHHLVTCITADHGEQLGEHGYCGAHADFYTETALVPLILHGPGIPRAQRIDRMVSTMDIAVTLLGTVGLGFPDPVEGVDLLRDRPQTHPLLIIGYPMMTRSLQLRDSRQSQVLNTDFHYRYGYLSERPVAEGERLSEVPQTRRSKTVERTAEEEDVQIVVGLPQLEAPGLHFAVARITFGTSRGATVEWVVDQRISAHTMAVEAGGSFIELFFPVTCADTLSLVIRCQHETTVDRVETGFVPRPELLRMLATPGTPLRRVETDLYRHLLTLRKYSEDNEIYDLVRDPEMRQSVLTAGGEPSVDVEALVAAVLEYRRLKLGLLGESAPVQRYTDEETARLRALGYL